jgi:hypothetical protein
MTVPSGFAASHSDSTMSAIARLAEVAGLMLASSRNRAMTMSSRVKYGRCAASLV